MTTTTQAGLVLALLAVLVLLLGLSRRQRRQRNEETADRPEPAGAAFSEEEQALDQEPGEQPTEALVVAPEPDTEPEPEPLLDVSLDSSLDTLLEQPAEAADEDDQVEEAEPSEELVDVEVAEETPAAEEVRPKRRRRWFFRRRRTTVEPDFGDLPALEVPQETADELAGELADELAVAVSDVADSDGLVRPRSPETPEQAELRTLREQLRALEQVVQEQVSEPPTAALARMEQAAAEQSAAYLRQVSMVVQGLAAHTPHEEHPQRTLARVAAAVERLGAPNAMRRPILPVTNHPVGRRIAAHRRDPLELGSTGVEESDTVTDVFSNLDVAGREYRHVGEPRATEPGPVEPRAAEPASAAFGTAATVQLEAAPQQAVAPAEQVAVPGAGAVSVPAPSTGEMTGHHLGHEGALSDVPAAPEPLPTHPEPEIVLPVPPPAVVSLDSRRRRRRRSST